MYPRDPAPSYPHQGGGYPPQQGGGYPPQQGGGGYPPQQGGGYPPQQGGGYPPQQGGGGYPPQQGGGYPPQQGGGYPPQQGGFQQPGGYPQPGGNQGGYPQPGGDQGGYPQPGGYQQPGIGFGNLEQSGYPPQNSGYPPQQSGGYPPQESGGYPPQNSGYPPQQSGGYPPQQSGGYPNPQQSNNEYPSYPGAPGQESYQQGGGEGPLYPALAGASQSRPTQQYDNPSLSQYGQQQQHSSGNYQGNNDRPVYEATVKEYGGFNPNDDADKLYKAMKGFGTDEATIIDVLCHRTSTQRMQVALAYKSGYGKDLLQNLKSECSGKFEELLKALMMTRSQLEASDLRKAIDGAGTDEKSLIDILCTKTNDEMIELKKEYKFLFKKDLEKDVGSDVSGYFKRFLVSLTAGFRSDNPPDHGKALQQAKELYEAGSKRMGTDEVKFNRIFAVESFPHLKLVFEEYRKLTGKDIQSAVKSEMSGYVEDSFLAVVDMSINPPQYFARRICETMKGAGTYDRALIRNMVLRSEIDMVNIKQEFQRMYGKSLESFIKSDTSGDYKRGLLCLAGDNGWR